jgi:hypothetical protein
VPLLTRPVPATGIRLPIVGIGPVFRDRRLRNIALWILLMTFASTTLYFVQSPLVGGAITDRALHRARCWSCVCSTTAAAAGHLTCSRPGGHIPVIHKAYP